MLVIEVCRHLLCRRDEMVESSELTIVDEKKETINNTLHL